MHFANRRLDNNLADHILINVQGTMSQSWEPVTAGALFQKTGAEWLLKMSPDVTVAEVRWTRLAQEAYKCWEDEQNRKQEEEDRCQAVATAKRDLSPAMDSRKACTVARVAPTPRPVGETEQEATPAQAPEPAGPVIELVEITEQDLDSIILYDGFAL